MSWVVMFYDDAQGRVPVREWLERLELSDPAASGRVRHYIDLLEQFGVLLEEPYTKQLEGKLRELRPGRWRVTYFADPRRRLILLTSFQKSSRKTDRKEIELARKRMLDWMDRVEKGER